MEFEIAKIVIALLVLVNPLGAIPLFISLTHDYSQTERKAIAKTAAIKIAHGYRCNSPNAFRI